MNEVNDGSLLERCARSIPARDRRNMVRYTVLLMLWAAAFLGVSYVARFSEMPEGLLGWIVTGIPSFVGFLAVIAYGQYLRNADELQRSIELNALAVAVGAGFVVWPAFRLIERIGEPYHDAPVLIMIACYMIASVVGRARYA